MREPLESTPGICGLNLPKIRARTGPGASSCRAFLNSSGGPLPFIDKKVICGISLQGSY